jgi:hypothetical protein
MERTHQNRRHSENGKPCSLTYAFELAMASAFSFQLLREWSYEQEQREQVFPGS